MRSFAVLPLPTTLVPILFSAEALLNSELQRRVAEVDVPERAVIATEPGGTIVHWNAGAERVYGWSGEEALGRNIVEVTPSELAVPEATEIMSALTRGEPWSGEFLVRAKNGSRFVAQVTNMPVLDEGTLVGIVGISRRVAYLNE